MVELEKGEHKLLKLSIIVCTCSPERLADLSELLESVDRQTHEDIETIVVVDEDLERGYLPQHMEMMKNIVGHRKVILLINGSNKGLTYSRNRGVQNATGDIVAFVDDDAVLCPNWAEEIINTFREDENAVGVTGEIAPIWENKSMKWFPRELWWIISCRHEYMPAVKQEVRNGFGTNMAYRKEALEEIGMFSTKLGLKKGRLRYGEEAELCIRLKENTGKKMIYNPGVKVRHKVRSYRLTIKNLIRRAYSEGYSKAFLSSICKSNILATESTYLQRLLINFYPRSLSGLLSKPLESLKRLMAVTIVVIAVGTGYLCFKCHRRIA